MSELRDFGRANLHLNALARSSQQHDVLLPAVRDAASGEFEVFGEIGSGPGGSIIYLARDLIDRRLVALALTAERGTRDEFTLDVLRELDSSVAAQAEACSRCGSFLSERLQFCTQCGAELSDAAGFLDDWTPEELREAAQAASGSRFRILGEMPRAGGKGVVYFARDHESGKIAALRLYRERDGSLSLGQTGYLKRVVAPPPPPPAPPPAIARAQPLSRTVPSPPPDVVHEPVFPDPATPTPRPVPAQDHRLPLLDSAAAEVKRKPLWLALGAVVLTILMVLVVTTLTKPDRAQERREGLRAENGLATAEPLPPVERTLPEVEPEPEPEPLIDLSSESVLEYSVAIASLTSLEDALKLAASWDRPETPLYIVPIEVRGGVYYRLLAGMLPQRSLAEGLMAELVALGIKDAARDWDVRPTRYAFLIGAYDTNAEAEAAIASLIGSGIPAYRVPAGSPAGLTRFYVYAGGYENSGEALLLEGWIERAGFQAELTDRKGLLQP